MKYAKITGTGSYLPSIVFTNDDWAKVLDTSDEWIYTRTGIRQRHFVGENETVHTMAMAAAKQAMEAANVGADQIDAVIIATCSTEQSFPMVACSVQAELGIPACIAFDINAACSGFMYALATAEQYIKGGLVKRALVVGAESMSRLMDKNDRSTAVLFGDGAGAVIVEGSDEPGMLSTKLYADGTNGEILALRRPVNPNADSVNGEPPKVHINMDGRRVFKEAVTALSGLVKAIQTDPVMENRSIDWLVPHQANIRIIQATAEKLNLPMDKVICTVEKHSNTSAASVPLALDTAVRDGRIQKGQTILLEAFGAGLTWGSILMEY